MNKREEYEEKVKKMGFDSVADYRRYLMYASDGEFMKYVSANVRKDSAKGNGGTKDDGWDSLDSAEGNEKSKDVSWDSPDSVEDSGSIKGSDKIREDFWDSMNLEKDADALQMYRTFMSKGKSATFNEKCRRLFAEYCGNDAVNAVVREQLGATPEELANLLQARVNHFGECHDTNDLFWYTMKLVGEMYHGEPIPTRDIITLLHMESLVNERLVESIAKFEQVSREQLSKIGCVEEPEIKLPERATVGSAGYDFFAPKDYTVAEGETVVIPTGVRCCMEPGWVLSLYPRSGMGFKYLVGLANTVGIIDSDYYYSDNEGHIMVKLVNRGSEPLEIKKGKAFCQGIFTKYGVTIDDCVKDIRNGGFNSTNK